MTREKYYSITLLYNPKYYKAQITTLMSGKKVLTKPYNYFSGSALGKKECFDFIKENIGKLKEDETITIKCIIDREKRKDG